MATEIQVRSLVVPLKLLSHFCVHCRWRADLEHRAASTDQGVSSYVRGSEYVFGRTGITVALPCVSAASRLSMLETVVASGRLASSMSRNHDHQATISLRSFSIHTSQPLQLCCVVADDQTLFVFAIDSSAWLRRLSTSRSSSSEFPDHTHDIHGMICAFLEHTVVRQWCAFARGARKQKFQIPFS